MGRYGRKCRGIGAIAVMEAPEVTTRITGAGEQVETVATRKRKAGEVEPEVEEVRNCRRCGVGPGSTAAVENSQENTASGGENGEDVLEASCCSSNGSSVHDEFTDLPEENEEVAMTSNNFELLERSETTEPYELEAKSAEPEPTGKPQEASSRRRSVPEISKMPSQAELDDFFSAAEKNLQKQFAQKYNYDIAKDEPVEGRYEWVQIKP